MLVAALSRLIVVVVYMYRSGRRWCGRFADMQPGGNFYVQTFGGRGQEQLAAPVLLYQVLLTGGVCMLSLHLCWTSADTFQYNELGAPAGGHDRQEKGPHRSPVFLGGREK